MVFRFGFRQGAKRPEDSPDIDPENVTDDVYVADDVYVTDDVAENELEFDAHDRAQDDQGEWLEIELHEWALETRSMLAQLLVAEGVMHAWQGTTLLTHQSVEAEVDALIEEAQSAETRPLDPALEQTAFEMTGWSGELQTQLSQRLNSVGVPHEFDAEGDLVCHEADEEHVDVLIEELLARAADSELDELDGLEANNLLSALFEATDRLRRDVRDPKGVLGAVSHGQRLATAATPFGFSASAWKSLRETVDQLVTLIESDDASDREISELASDLRNSLQRLV